MIQKTKPTNGFLRSARERITYLDERIAEKTHQAGELHKQITQLLRIRDRVTKQMSYYQKQKV